MFRFFKADPLKSMEKKRAQLLQEAMHIQRSGDLKQYALKMAAIDNLEKEMEILRSKKAAN